MDLLPKRDLRHPLLRIEHLSKSFGAHEVLRDIDFTVYRGDVISVIGSSGSGKSTLLRCVNLLETPSSGEIRFHSSNILSPGINVPGYRAKVGMVFQSFNLFDNMSVLKNCEIGQRKVLSRGAEEAREKAMHYLRKVGMAPYVNALPRQLSGGQKQRVAIARALMRDPAVLLADEPVASLDPVTGRQILELLRAIQRGRGVSVLMNSHNLELSLEFSDHIIGINRGRIVFDGAPSDVTENVLRDIYGGTGASL